MRLTLVVLLLSVAGCAANKFKDSYTSASGVAPRMASATNTGGHAVPLVTHLSGALDDQALSAYLQQGYRMIGSSKFSAKEAPQDQSAIEQATLVGADLVVMPSPTLESTVTKQLPKTVMVGSSVPTDGTGEIGFSGTGDYGSTYGSGSGTRLKTVYEPVTVNRYSYTAYYFVKSR